MKNRKILYPILCWIILIFRRPITIFFSLLGIPIIYSMAFVLFLSAWLFFRSNHFVIVFERKEGIYSLLVMLFIYIYSIVFRYNQNVMNYFSDFIVYCVLTSIYCSQIRNSQLAIKAFCYCTIAVFVICSLLPFANGLRVSYGDLPYFGSGMNYGEYVSEPCFIGLYLLFRYYKKKWALFINIFNIALMFILANRSALIVSFFFVLVYEMWIENKGIKKNIIVALLTIGTIFVLINLEGILLAMYDILEMFGMKSYSITKYIFALQSNESMSSAFLSGRDNISQIAMTLFKEHPIFGIGIGNFYTKTGIPFTHNLFTDVLSSTGIMGSIVFFIIIFTSVKKTLSIKNKEERVFSTILLTMWFPRLLLSKTFVNDVFFWTYIVYILSSGNDRKNGDTV